MAKYKTIEDEINAFLELWDVEQNTNLCVFLDEYFRIFNVTEDEDWIANKVGGTKENIATIRFIRTVYLISRLADDYAGRLCTIKAHFKGLWERMEQVKDED